MSIPYVLTEQGISCYGNGRMRTLTKEHPFFDVILNALKTDKKEVIYWVTNPQYYLDLQNLSEIKYIDKDQFSYLGMRIPYSFMRQILSYSSEGKEKEPLLKFLEKVNFFPLDSKRKKILNNLNLDYVGINEKGNLVFLGEINTSIKEIEGKSFSTIKGFSIVNEGRVRIPYSCIRTAVELDYENTEIELDPRFLINVFHETTGKFNEFHTVSFKPLRVIKRS